MAEPHALPITPAHLLCVYAEPLVRGRRLLVVGDATAGLGERLLELGARAVHVYDSDGARARQAPARRGLSVHGGDEPMEVRDGAFEVGLVPELEHVRDPAACLARLRRIVGPDGAVLVAARNAPGSLDYYELYDQVSLQFASVRMLGQVPFHGVAIAELGDVEDPEVTVDTQLVEASEAPTHFVALAAQREQRLAGYAILQLPPQPAAPIEAAPRVDETLHRELVEVRVRADLLRTQLDDERARVAALTPAAEQGRRAEGLEQRARDLEAELEALRASAHAEMESSRGDAEGAWRETETARREGMDARREAEVVRQELDQARRELHQAREELGQLQQGAEQAAHQQQHAGQAQHQSRQELADVRRELADVRRELQEARGEAAGARQERDVARHELDQARAELQDGRAEASRLREQLQGARADASRARDELSAARDEVVLARQELEQMHRAPAAPSLDEQLAVHATELSQLEQTLRERGKVVQELERELAARARMVEGLLDQIEEGGTPAAPATGGPDDVAGLVRANAELRDRLDQLALETARREGEIETRGWRIAELEERLAAR